MNKHFWICLVGVLCICAVAQGKKEVLKMKVASFNILGEGKNKDATPWNNRSTAICLKMHKLQADVMGFQEVDSVQLTDLQQGLPEYVAIGEKIVPPTNTNAPLPRLNELNAIFYKKNNFRVISNGTFWLSDTPDVISRGWNNTEPNGICWAVLQHIKTGISFLYANIHMGKFSPQQRTEAAILVKTYLSKLSNSTPVILAGDFEATDQDDYYTTLLTRYFPLQDTWTATKPKFNGVTLNAFGMQDLQMRSDFILTTPNIKIKSLYTEKGSIGGKIYLSDHDILVSEMTIFP